MDTPQKTLIITGSAPCMLDDLTVLATAVSSPSPLTGEGRVRVECLFPAPSECDFMAIGLDAVDKYGWPIKYVATYHPEDIPQILARREARIGRVDFTIICHVQCDHVDIVIKDYWTPSGSSALLGVQAALRMGYKRIILCGCPLIGKNDKGSKYESFRTGWEARKKELAACVRSMSGWTRDFLGAPTEEWLLSGEKQ